MAKLFLPPRQISGRMMAACRARKIAAPLLLTVASALMMSSIGLRGGGQSAADSGVTFVGAGDIANCKNLAPARATARLLDRIDGTIFTLGDHAYPHGDAQEFRDCYGPTWGRHKARTRPTIGNHDTITSHGRPYFDYFQDDAGPERRGYYSFELGAWHIVSLNSGTSMKPESPQLKWLREDLAIHTTECSLAYWHVPRFSSGPDHDQSESDLWRVLYEAGVDVVLNGHEHAYERFAPQDDQGRPDPARGIREFIVGTGGGEPAKLNQAAPNSEIRSDHLLGVLKLTLGAHDYAWEFVSVAGQPFADTGSARCSPRR
jgi:hypothetical protein